MWLLALCFGASFPLTAAVLYAPSYATALALLFVVTHVGSLYAGQCSALIQNLSGPSIRSTGAALFLTVANLVGLGLGPTVTGWPSDLLGGGSAQALGESILIASLTYLLSAAAFLIATRTVLRDLEEAEGS